MAFNMTNSVQAEKIQEAMLEFLPQVLVSANGVKYYGDNENNSSIKIPFIDKVTTQVYTGADMTITPAGDSSVVITYDLKKAFATTIDDTDEFESPEILINMVSRSGIETLAQDVDVYTFGVMGAGAGDSITAEVPTTSNVIDTFLDASEKLDLVDAPAGSQYRSAFVSPLVAKMLAKANIDLTTSTTQNDAITRGFVGEFAGFKIYKSNNLPDATAGTGNKNLFVYNEATALAQSINKVAVVDREESFSKLAKGLTSVGSKILRSTMVISYDDSIA